MDFRETYSPGSEPTTSVYLLSVLGYHGWNIDQLDVVGACSNLVLKNVDIYMMLPEGSPEHLNPATISIQLMMAL
jgi:hypothetical protein